MNVSFDECGDLMLQSTYSCALLAFISLIMLPVPAFSFPQNYFMQLKLVGNWECVIHVFGAWKIINYDMISPNDLLPRMY